jgi:hypothetical protein
MSYLHATCWILVSRWRAPLQGLYIYQYNILYYLYG